MGPVVLVLCTVPEAAALPLVDALLAERLIACANLLGPLRSRYRWQGAIQDSTETLLLLKTMPHLLAGLRAAIVARHPYEVPEVLEFTAAGGLDRYLQWVAGAVRPPAGGGQ